MLVFLTLSRLISPSDIGLMAIVELVLGIGLRVLSSGAAEPLVQFQQLDRKHADTFFWSIQAVGWLASIVVALASPLIAMLFQSSALQSLLTACSLVLVLQATSLVPEALLSREMRFFELSRSLFASQWLGGICGIGAAWCGAGVWSLVVHRLATSAFMMLLVLFAARYRPRLHWSREHYHQMVGFSSSRMLEGLVLYADQNAPRLLLGLYGGPEPLGYFAFAKNITESIAKFFNVPIRTIAFSAMSKIQDDLPRVRSAYREGLALTTAVIFPCCAGLALVASDVADLFGNQWQTAILPLQLLAIASIRTAFQVWNAALLRALGRPRLLLSITLLRGFTAFAISFLLLDHGAAGVAAGVLIAGLITSPLALKITRVAISLTWSHQMLPALYPFLAAIVMAICVTAMRIAIPSSIPAGWRFLGSVLLGILTYLLSLYLLDPCSVRRWVGDCSRFKSRSKDSSTT